MQEYLFVCSEGGALLLLVEESHTVLLVHDLSLKCSHISSALSENGSHVCFVLLVASGW